MPDFQPFVPPSENRPEFTLRAILLGCFFGLIFGAVTVYVGLRAGLTVAASIPIAVLSISILRAFGRASILENIIVQTTGNAGQSIAAGVIFTLPALIFLGFDLEYSRIFMLALIGGWLGVLFMIPLRRQLIVEEHGTLHYPEGTACADVLDAGERGGSFASRVFFGLGLGAPLHPLPERKSLRRLARHARVPARLRPAARAQRRVHQGRRHAGVSGRGLHHRPARRRHHLCRRRLLLARAHAADLLLRQGSAHPVYPGTVPIAQMGPSDLWATYIRPMGAGAVAAAGLITLFKTLPTIVGALGSGFKNMRAGAAAKAPSPSARKTTSPWARSSSARIAHRRCMFLFLEFKPVPGAHVGWAANLAASLLVVVFGFLFVTVSSRIVGLIGSSANPISGMTIATLMATSAIFLVNGWTAPAFGALAITIGGVVCIAAANAGDTSQDLKTGYLVGATPRHAAARASSSASSSPRSPSASPST